MWCAIFASSYAISDETQSVDTTYVKASKELPKVLYVVPWKDVNSLDDTEQKLVLHNFFGDLYDPVLPDDIQISLDSNVEPRSSK